MPVRIDPDGWRSVQAEAEAPGTPEQVWEAIASGPGISSWFVPTELDQRVGGVTTSNFGPGMETRATITTWEPPHRYIAESHGELGPDGPTVATEWVVEARDDGVCTVRVVHRWFTSTDDWDGQFEGHSYGWASFFRILALYLREFAGQAASQLQAQGFSSVPLEAAWATLTKPLGLAGSRVGTRVAAQPGAPSFAGIVEWAGQPAWPNEYLVRLEQPAPGIAHLFPMPMGEQVLLTTRLYLFGASAPVIAAAAEASWHAWLEERLPLPEQVTAE
ncbi:MAG: ATPase [Chloroflexi bacterium]|nr:MAG: ATPase [Chloroflexota bacterium]